MPLLTIVSFALILGALVDIITRPDDRVKHLPKMVWVFIVVFLPLIGSIVWFAVGHDWSHVTVPAPSPSRRQRTSPRPPMKRDERSTEEQLAELEREIEDYERIRRLEAEIEERRRRRGELD